MTKEEVMKEIREHMAEMKYCGVLNVKGIYLDKFTKKELIEIATFLGNQLMCKEG